MDNVKDLSKKYVLNTYNRFDLVFEKGEGVWLFTDKDEKFLDMASGIAVSAMGYNNKKLVASLTNQLPKLLHTSNYFYNIPSTKLAEKLVKNTIFSKIFFCNSGAEANEGAIKLARKFGHSISENKHTIITLKNSFHGRTITTLSATGQTKYQKNFHPLTEGFIYAEPNDLNDLESKFNNNVAALMLEPIQGEAGVIPLTKDFLKKARELCDKHNSLLIYDEVQTGVGRTGKLFAYEHFLPIEPDVITIAKGLAAGLPIGCFMVKEKYENVLQPGEHASTFGGNPLSATAALTELDTMLSDNFLEHLTEKSIFFLEELNKLKEKFPKIIVDIRGMGFLIGVEFSITAREIIDRLIKQNIIAIPAGEKTVRFIPPLVIKNAELKIAINALEKILQEIT